MGSWGLMAALQGRIWRSQAQQDVISIQKLHLHPDLENQGFEVAALKMWIAMSRYAWQVDLPIRAGCESMGA